MGTLDLITSSTHKILPTSAGRKTPKKCFEFEPKFVSNLNGRKLREKRCLKNGSYDWCFSLQAQVLDRSTRKVIATEWRDCATESRDCHAIANKCAVLRELATNRGAEVKTCSVSCCREDLCNAFGGKKFPTNMQLEIESGDAGRPMRIGQITILLSIFPLLNSLL